MSSGESSKKPKRSTLIRVYETTVVDPKGDFSTEFSVVPLSSLETSIARRIRKAKSVNLDDWERIWQELGFEAFREVNPKRVAASVTELFEYGEYTVPHPEEFVPDEVSTVRARAVRNFTRKVARAEIIPVEESPLRPESLAGLISRGTGGMGAATAWFGFWMGKPALIVGGLFGIVVVKVFEGYATGAQKGAEKAGERHVLRLLRVPEAKKHELGPPND